MIFMTHDSFKDVFIEVLKTQYRGLRYRKLRVRWWNLGFSDNPWLCFPEPQTIKIMESDWKRWSFFTPGALVHPGRV